MIYTVRKVYIFIFLFNLLSFLPVLAQQTAKEIQVATAEQAIQDLKNGALIVRLQSKNNKIQKLEELIASPEVSASKKEQLRKELTATIDDRNRYNIELVTAITDLYSFSQVYFMYDTASISLKNGTRNGIFLNANMEYDPGITLKEDHFFVLRTGTTDSSTTTGLSALVIMDDKLKDMKRPFPYYVRINSVKRLFVRIFNPKKIVRKDAKEVVAKLDSQLKQYYKDVT